jgi:hypothetical protein
MGKKIRDGEDPGGKHSEMVERNEADAMVRHNITI